MILVVPMAGAGSRFAKAGYIKPKPFIDVDGQPMIKRVLDTLPKCDKIILISLHQWTEEEQRQVLGSIDNIQVINLHELTDGAVRTVLMAKEYIDNDDELIIANSDQLISFDHQQFDEMRNNSDGIIFTFRADHPKWSYVKIENEVVTKVVEKEVISNDATCGVYYFRKGSDYVRAAEEMIRINMRVNGEFYNAPVYNLLIEEGKVIRPFLVSEMHGLGTPEDLEFYLRSHQ
jgi:NDP-sugar pyrophosphorylase family protein